MKDIKVTYKAERELIVDGAALRQDYIEMFDEEPTEEDLIACLNKWAEEEYIDFVKHYYVITDEVKVEVVE